MDVVRDVPVEKMGRTANHEKEARSSYSVGCLVEGLAGSPTGMGSNRTSKTMAKQQNDVLRQEMGGVQRGRNLGTMSMAWISGSEEGCRDTVVESAEQSGHPDSELLEGPSMQEAYFANDGATTLGQISCRNSAGVGHTYCRDLSCRAHKEILPTKDSVGRTDFILEWRTAT